jgi:hypothetical protein
MSDPAADVSLRKDSPSPSASSSLVASSTRGVRTAARVASFTESVIRDMTGRSNEQSAINLAQGFPDLAAFAEMKEAAVAAIRLDPDERRAAVSSRTRAIVIDTSHDPSRKVGAA